MMSAVKSIAEAPLIALPTPKASTGRPYRPEIADPFDVQAAGDRDFYMAMPGLVKPRAHLRD